MSDGTPLFGGLHIDLTDAEPVLHTVHPDGELSVCMTGQYGSLAFYLTGTPDELRWLCDKLRTIVTAHESQTTLAGAGARLAMHQANCGHTWLDANNDNYLECRYCGKRFTDESQTTLAGEAAKAMTGSPSCEHEVDYMADTPFARCQKCGAEFGRFSGTMVHLANRPVA